VTGAPEPESKGTVTFSVRLTEEQRDRLTKAAELRGWTSTNLLRTAALEKAAHIVNTSTLTKMDFRTLAMEIASCLFGERRAYTLSRSGGNERMEAPVYEDLTVPLQFPEFDADYVPVEVEPKRMTVKQLEYLIRASRYGGSEFLSMVIDACSSVTAPNRSDLPDPIDPNAA
jgi:uncharacterized protein (DUF1778 family)